MIREELETQYRINHDNLTRQYYQEKVLTEIEFRQLHAQNYQEFETAMIAGGFMNPRPIPTPEVDWKALWQAADTVAKKIIVLAKRLELE